MASSLPLLPPFSIRSPSEKNNSFSSSKFVKVREDWRQKSKPIRPGGIYPSKDHCRFRNQGKGPSKPAPKFVGNLIAFFPQPGFRATNQFILMQIGPKGMEFGRYSLDYRTIRNYLYVNRKWGKQRAGRHLPSYAKKIVESYNKKGIIDLMISQD